MKVKLLFFAMIREKIGKDEVDMEIFPGETLEQLTQRVLAPAFPHARFFKSLLYAVNEEYAGPQTILRDGDEVAFIPPVAGG